MKKYLLATTLLFFTALVYATSPTIIQGKWNREGETVSLYQIISGRLEVMSTFNLQDDRNFGFFISPEKEGYYVIGNGYPGAHSDKYMFYFKPGDKLNVEITEDSYKLVGENTPENSVIEAWHNKIQPLEYMSVYFYKKSSTYVDFFPLLEEFIENNGINTIPNTGNKVFDESFKKMSQIDLLSIAAHFGFTPRASHPHADEYPNYYRDINITELTSDDSLLDYPFGSIMIDQLLYLSRTVNNQKGATPFKEAMSLLNNDAIKGEYILSQAEQIKTYVGYKELMSSNDKYLTSEDQRNRAKEIKVKLVAVQGEGEPAIDFTYKDINNKSISLSDFKGKVVYVDVWATWCGPCKTEMPHLNKLAKELEGEDIVFLGVSLDEEKDYDKWKEFLNTEEMTGIQLFAGGFKSDIAKFYSINSIPRFMVFDKEGNIVSKDAPRPSEKEIKTLLDFQLKK